MTDADRALAPLNAAGAAIETLDTYRTPQELAASLQAIGQAVERSLRQLLRADTRLPDQLRLSALSEQDLPYDSLIQALRKHDIIEMRDAGMLHELRQSATRAAAGTVRAADADNARAVVDRIRAAITGRDDAGLRAVAHAAVERGHIIEEPHAVAPRSSRTNRAILVLGVLAFVALIAWALLRFLGASSPMAEGIEAFKQERWGLAEAKFRAALSEDADNVTAGLYLGRVLRAQARPQEAAQVLNDVRRHAPADADVLREMGHAFMDMKRAMPAVEAYRRAQEIEPGEPANWIGLVRAMRAANDPGAEQVLERAPAEAQAVLRSR